MTFKSPEGGEPAMKKDNTGKIYKSHVDRLDFGPVECLILLDQALGGLLGLQGVMGDDLTIERWKVESDPKGYFRAKIFPLSWERDGYLYARFCPAATQHARAGWVAFEGELRFPPGTPEVPPSLHFQVKWSQKKGRHVVGRNEESETFFKKPRKLRRPN